MTSISSTALLAFRSLDVDGSKGLSATELKQGAALLPTQMRQAIAKDGAASVLKNMDTDEDGKVSQQELSTGIASLTSQSAASALIAAQESQSQTDQMLVGVKSSLVSLLKQDSSSASTTSLSTAMQNILAAYASEGKV